MTSWPVHTKGERLGPQIRWAQILAAGVEIAAERGFRAVRAQEVAERAGCCVGLVRLYGGRRHELWKAIAQRALITREYRVIAEARRLDLLPK